MREIKFKFILEHKESKEIVTTRPFTLEELINCYGEETILESHHCNCQPVGETNVVDCNCDDYYSGFKIIEKFEYTGLKDKNGTEIYEGDVIRYNIDYSTHKVEYIENHWYSFCFINVSTDEYNGLNEFGDIEVIGNIHENKNLLK